MVIVAIDKRGVVMNVSLVQKELNPSYTALKEEYKGDYIVKFHEYSSTLEFPIHIGDTYDYELGVFYNRDGHTKICSCPLDQKHILDLESEVYELRQKLDDLNSRFDSYLLSASCILNKHKDKDIEI